MGFWIYMLIMVLLIPLSMIIFGAIYIKNPPKNINTFSGYRTEKSMASKETWEYSHKLFGKLWLILGLVSLPIFSIPMLFLINESTTVISYVGLVLTFLEFIPMIVPVIPTEIMLKKNFDENGNKIPNQKHK
ncbi:MAG: SdpI family protein [Clostridia bacterium]|nr:SdpI family protein [Clostridia bacterium]